MPDASAWNRHRGLTFWYRLTQHLAFALLNFLGELSGPRLTTLYILARVDSGLTKHN